MPAPLPRHPLARYAARFSIVAPMAAFLLSCLLRGAIDRYHLDMNKYPAKLSDLWEKPTDETAAEKWGGPYVEALKPDPWDQEYQYLAEGEKNTGKYDFWSNGPDGESGTDDDIGNWVK